MFTRTAIPSFHKLRRKVTPEILGNLQPILLLQILAGISHTVNNSVSHSRALARTLLLSGQQRLCDLLAAAPRLHLPVEQALKICRSGDVDSDADRTPEEVAAQALLELCLGLMLQWMVKAAHRGYAIGPLPGQQRNSPLYFLSFPSSCPPRARSCPYTALA